MSLARGIDGPSRHTSTRPDARVSAAHEELRPAVRTDELGTGTLACERCDAPVSPGPYRLSPVDRLRCPFCRHEGPVREFLSLGRPARPARVVVRVRI